MHARSHRRADRQVEVPVASRRRHAWQGLGVWLAVSRLWLRWRRTRQRLQ